MKTNPPSVLIPRTTGRHATRSRIRSARRLLRLTLPLILLVLSTPYFVKNGAAATPLHYILDTNSDWAQLQLIGPETWSGCSYTVLQGGGGVSCTDTRTIHLTNGNCSTDPVTHIKSCQTFRIDYGPGLNGLRGGDSTVDYMMTVGAIGVFLVQVLANGQLIAFRYDNVQNYSTSPFKFSLPSDAHTTGDIHNTMIYFLKTTSDWTKLILTGPETFSGVSWIVVKGGSDTSLSVSNPDSKTLYIHKAAYDATEVWVQFTVTLHWLSFGNADPNDSHVTWTGVPASGVPYDIQKGGINWTTLDIYQGFSPSPYKTKIYTITNSQTNSSPLEDLKFNVRSNDHIFWTDIAGAFYYPWYGNQAEVKPADVWRHWHDPCTLYNASNQCIQYAHFTPYQWASNYEPDYINAHVPATNLYSSNDFSAVLWQIGLMRMSMIDVAISSWWGAGTFEDQAFRNNIVGNPSAGVSAIMDRPDNPYPGLKWAIMDELPYYNTQSESQIYNDLSYIMTQYGSNPHYLRIDGKPVVFVFGMRDSDVANWLTAKQNIVLNFAPVYLNIYPSQWFSPGCNNKTCLSENQDSTLALADAYFDYNSNLTYRVTTSCDAGCPSTSDSPSGQSETVHVGYNEFPERCAKDSLIQQVALGCNPLAEDPGAFSSGWDTLVSNRGSYRFLLMNTWNEYHEGSMMEPSRQIIHDMASLPFPEVSPPNNFFTAFVDVARQKISSFKLGYPLVDYTPPTSTVSVPANSPPSFLVTWSGTDDNGGPASFDIQYQDLTTSAPWTNWQIGTQATSATFLNGFCGHTYQFRSQARDTSGNVKFYGGSEASTTITSSCTMTVSASPSIVPADAASTSTITAQLSDNALGVTITFSATAGTLSASSCTTSSLGSCSTTLKSSTAGTVTITASAPSYTNGQTSVAFVDFSISTSPALSSTSSLAIDGTASAFCSHSTNSCQATFSTSRVNDIVIVYTFEALDLQAICTFGVSDTAGLSWTLRASVAGRNEGGTNRDQIAEFWAKTPSVLSSDLITETISGCAGSYGGEYNGLQVFAVSGANLNNPFDPNTSLPSSAFGNSPAPSTTVSTSNPNDIILGVVQQSSFGVLTPGSGFTTIISTGGWSALSEYQPATSPVTNFPVTFGDSASFYWEVIADAIAPGATATITVTGVNGFAGTVSLSDNPLPAGLTCTAITPASLTIPPAPATATLSCSSTTPNTYTVTITGTSGSLTHTATATFTFVDFTISATSPAAVNAGSSATSTITVTALNGFAGTVYLSDTPLPAGLTCTATSPASVTLPPSPETATLSCSAAAAGTFTVTITGTSGSLTHTATVSMTFNDFSFTASPTLVTFNAGSTSTSTISLASLNGFAGTVAISASSPTGVSASCVPSSVPLSPGGTGSSTCTFSSSNAGTYSVTITGTSGAIVHSFIVTVKVVDFQITASPTSLSVGKGSSGTSTITVSALNDFSGTVSLTASISGASSKGPFVSLSSSSVSCSTGSPGTSVLTVSTLSGTPKGTYTITVTAINGALTHQVTLTVTVT